MLLRITPAGAGKTFTSPVNLKSGKDHPRRCGENRLRKRGCWMHAGSPPQVRGKPCSMPCSTARFRITPAGAGKTIRMNLRPIAATDHPRRCGENGAHVRRWCCGMGSPPQVRGKHIFDIFSCFPHGITPAGAGKTSPPR